MCASACPPAKKKTLLVAKDWYHSVALALGESREVTEFLCEFGYYRCVKSGQKGSYVVAMPTHIDLIILHKSLQMWFDVLIIVLNGNMT